MFLSVKYPELLDTVCLFLGLEFRFADRRLPSGEGGFRIGVSGGLAASKFRVIELLGVGAGVRFGLVEFGLAFCLKAVADWLGEGGCSNISVSIV